MTPWVLTSPDGGSRATFYPERGGVGSSLIFPDAESHPQEHLFLHPWFQDPSSPETPGGWPVLFPICGRLENGAYRHEGAVHALPIHGFGFRQPWEARQDGVNGLVMRLVHNSETRAMYPFAFEVELRYRLENGALHSELTVVNRGGKPLPYSAGFHPYFLTPPPGQGREKMRVEFTPDEAFLYTRTFTGIEEKVPVPPMPISIEDPLLGSRVFRLGDDRSVRLLYPDGRVLGLMADERYPYLQLYAMAGQPFICVEPWMALPNALNTGAGLRWVPPGERETSRVQVRLEHR